MDWEISRHGIPGLDLGQFCAEMELLAMFKPQCAEAAKEGIVAFMSAYMEGCQEHEDKKELTRRMVVHVGAHLVTWPSRVPWGSVAETRNAVKEGVKLLVYGSEGGSDIAQRLVRSVSS